MKTAYEILRKRFSVTPKIPLHVIAVRAGITTSALSQIESNRIKRPRYDTVLKIQAALETLIAERQGQKSPTPATQTNTPGGPPIDPTT